MIHRPYGCQQFWIDLIVPINSVYLVTWVMLKNFEVLFSKNHCNIWPESAAAVWEKILPIPILNGPDLIVPPIDDR